MEQSSLIIKPIDLQKAFYSHTWQRYELVAPNLYLNGKSNEMDIFGARKSGYVDEIEIKLSLPDFKADFKKYSTSYTKGPPYRRIDRLKHDLLREGLLDCNYFSFLMPEDLAERCEIPDYAGLYIYKPPFKTHSWAKRRAMVSEVKRAPLLHKRKITDKQKYNVVRKMAYRYWESIR